jgi:hypothetical protein
MSMLTVPEKRFREGNEERCIKVDYTAASIDALRHRYHSIRGLPGFIDDFIHLNPESGVLNLLKDKPELVQWTQDGQFLIVPNYPRVNGDLLKQAPCDHKKAEGGVSLIAWYVHPAQLENTVFEVAKNRDDFREALDAGCFVGGEQYHNRDVRHIHQERIRDLEKRSGVPYIASVLDLNPSHIASLQALKESVLDHLKEQYQIDADDTVQLYFHGVISDKTTTLHLHARVNEGLHPFEQQKCLPLDDVIDALENGISVSSLLIDKGVHYMSCSEMSKVQFLDDIRDVSMSVVDNPFLLDIPRVAPFAAVAFRTQGGGQGVTQAAQTTTLGAMVKEGTRYPS